MPLPKRQSEYSVIINVMAHDIKDAAENASQFLNQGNTPDAIAPVRSVFVLDDIELHIIMHALDCVEADGIDALKKKLTRD